MWDQRWRFPGKSLIDLGGVHAQVRFKEALAQDARREALWQARMGYWHLYQEQEIYTVRKDAEKQWRRFRELLVSRGLAGQWISLKLIKAQLGLARDSNDFITAKERTEVAKSHLRHVLGQEAGTDFRLSGPDRLKDFSQAERGHLHQDHREHPQVSAAAETLAQARARLAAARAAFLPDLNTRLWTDDRVTGADGFGFRVGLQVPLGLSQATALSKAGGEVKAAEQNLKAARDLVHHQLEEARVGAQSAWNLVALYETGGLIAQAEQAWNFAQQAWRNEGLSLADFIESYDSYLDIRSAHIHARANYGKALARLDYETGIFESKE
jgi:outer membrane protein TolC